MILLAKRVRALPLQLWTSDTTKATVLTSIDMHEPTPPAQVGDDEDDLAYVLGGGRCVPRTTIRSIRDSMIDDD